jgi:hypothetical protein
MRTSRGAHPSFLLGVPQDTGSIFTMRRSRAFLTRGVATGLIVGLGAITLVSTLPVTAGVRQSPARAIKKGRLGLGDSVMLGAKSNLNAKGIKVDATVSRQYSAAPGIVRSRRNAGTLPKKLIVHLGTNGYIEPSDCNAVVKAARSRSVYLVTLKVPRPWRTTNNKRLRSCAKRHARATLIDWYAYSKGHDSWFVGKDGYHLTTVGRQKYAGLIGRRTKH